MSVFSYRQRASISHQRSIWPSPLHSIYTVAFSVECRPIQIPRTSRICRPTIYSIHKPVITFCFGKATNPEMCSFRVRVHNCGHYHKTLKKACAVQSAPKLCVYLEPRKMPQLVARFSVESADVTKNQTLSERGQVKFFFSLTTLFDCVGANQLSRP